MSKFVESVRKEDDCDDRSITKEEDCDDRSSTKDKEELNHKIEILWKNVTILLILHLIALYGFYLSVTTAKRMTIIYNVILGYGCGLGLTVGGHRLWSHRSFKATLPMRIFLMVLHTVANEGAIYYWARAHRIHHKFCDTNADPYNATRGFFFAHMGWLMLKEHPDVKKKGKELDLSDLISDPVVRFQKKYYLILMPILSIIIPTWIPMYFWDETLQVVFFTTMFRYITMLNVVLSFNSASHYFGYKPFNTSTTATDNPYTWLVIMGENFHNYHHTFPWDYAVPETPFFNFDLSAKFIELFSLFGLTYDLKTVPLDLVIKQAQRRGDGTFRKSKIHDDKNGDNFSHFAARMVQESEVSEQYLETMPKFVKSVRKEEDWDDRNSTKGKELNHKAEIRWKIVNILLILHLIALYGLYLSFTTAKRVTIIYNFIVMYASMFGLAVGGHRLWSHRSFKATLPMSIFLMVLHTVANQGAIYYWAREHRIHHKFTDTNADPYNSKRGFFFAHMGWLMLKVHPDVKKKGKGVDVSDLINDPVVRFQKKYYLIFMPILSIIIPTWIPMYFWEETLEVAFFTTMFRYILTLNIILSFNSASHYFGYKPFNNSTTATDNPYTSLAIVGEGFHNYHHTFPWDYTVPETPFFTFDAAAKFIEFFSLFGLTYDLKTVPLDLVMKQAQRKGDVAARMVQENAVSEQYLETMPKFVESVRKEEDCDDRNSSKGKEELNRKTEIRWKIVNILLILHLTALYGLYLSFTTAKSVTIIYNFIVMYASIFGLVVGGHRLWSHRSFKATLPMSIFLMVLHTVANQGAIYYWAREHRIHHKFTDTNADPYNSKRGFFFAHMGWLMLNVHPDVKKKGKGVDVSDLINDPVVRFQKKYFLILMPILSIIIPTWIPMHFWEEKLEVAFFTTMFRYILTLNIVLSFNSASHYFGYKPFNISTTAKDNPYTSLVIVGDGFHNYHHTFPWDYTVPETPFFTFDAAAKFIEFFSLFGLTYDLKTVPLDLVMKQAQRKGDGTFRKIKNS